MKRVCCIFCCLILFWGVFTVCAQSDEAANWTYGDVNWDGRIDAADALWVLVFSTNSTLYYELDPNSADEWVYQLTMESDPHLVLYDVNLNYEINASDALMILQRSVGLIDCFPAESNPIPPYQA